MATTFKKKEIEQPKSFIDTIAPKTTINSPIKEEPKMSPAPTTPNNNNVTPKITKDETTKTYTLEIPGQQPISNLKTKEVSGLIKGYYDSTARTEQVRANYEQQKLSAQATPMTTPEVSQAEISSVGQLSNEINPQTILNTDDNVRALYTDIINKAKAREGNAGIGLMDTLVGVLPGGKYKKELIENMITNPDRKDFLSGYSNEKNLKSVLNNLDLTDKDIDNAKTLAAIPGRAKEAIMLYNTAQAKKQLYYSELKAISQADQRAYTDEIKDKMTEIEAYWAVGSGKTIDDETIKSTLNKLYGVR